MSHESNHDSSIEFNCIGLWIGILWLLPNANSGRPIESARLKSNWSIVVPTNKQKKAPELDLKGFRVVQDGTED